MDMKFGINKTNLSKAFIARDKEIFADSRHREKKKRSTKVLKKRKLNEWLKDSGVEVTRQEKIRKKLKY